jgi:hypothetical protein
MTYLSKITLPDGSIYQVKDIEARTAAGAAIPSTEKGAANGVAVLDENGRLTEAQLPAVIGEQIILKSSTKGSTKKFRLTIDDDGVISTEEVIEE